MRPLALLVFVLLLPSCSSLQSILDSLGKPSASLAGFAFKDLDFESLTLDFDVLVDNPYTVDIPLLGIDYGLQSGGASILAGALEPSQSIPAGGSSNLSVPAKIKFKDILSILSGVKPGAVVPWDAAFDVKLDVPGIEGYSIPLGTSGNLPIPTVPEVSLGGVHWSELSLSKATANIDLAILNTNDFGFDLNELLYELELGGKKVASAGVAPGTSFSSGEKSSLKIPISFAPKDLGLAVFNILTGSEAGYSIAGNMDLGTEYGDILAPFAKSGITSLFK